LVKKVILVAGDDVPVHLVVADLTISRTVVPSSISRIVSPWPRVAQATSAGYTEFQLRFPCRPKRVGTIGCEARKKHTRNFHTSRQDIARKRKAGGKSFVARITMTMRQPSTVGSITHARA
jgi:hypothetical protein